jgi:ABC-2 type transport system permease protein
MLKRYLKVFYQSFLNNIAVEMSFRLNFILIFVVEALWLSVLLGMIYIQFQHVDHIGPWNRQEYYLFATFVSIFDNFFLAIFAPNFWNFSETLRTGSLDFLLTKPMNSLFLMLTQVQRFSGLISALFSTGILIYFAFQLERDWKLWHYLALGCLFLVSLVLRVGMEVLVGSLMFVTIEGEAINVFRINLQAFAKNPAFIYTGALGFFVTRIFPLCLVTYLPIDWMLSSHSGAYFFKIIGIFVFFSGIIWWIALKVWAWGIRHYESASS